MCWVYILYSSSLDCYYIGSSDDPDKRLLKHLANHAGFSGKAKDGQIVHTESFETRADALKREKQLKAWKSKIRIRELIERTQLVRVSRP